MQTQETVESSQTLAIKITDKIKENCVLVKQVTTFHLCHLAFSSTTARHDNKFYKNAIWRIITKFFYVRL